MKKILIISEYITPVQGIGAIRWTKLLKYLAKNGEFTIDVLTDEKDFSCEKRDGNRQKLDVTLQKDEKYINKYHIVKNNAFLRMYYKRKNEKQDATNQKESAKYVQSMVTPKETSFIKQSIIDIVRFFKDVAQANQAIKYYKNNNLNYDIIISSFGPIWPHLVAKNIKKTNKNTVWLADFRDPVYLPKKHAILSSYYKNFAKNNTSNANCIVMAWDTLNEILSMPKEQKYIFIPNGYDLDDKQKDEGVKQFYLTYTGVLYSKGEMIYDLSPVFKALAELKKENVLNENKVKINYAGGDTDRFLAQAKNANAIEFAYSFGVLPRQEALKLQQDSAMLLVCAWNTKSIYGYITGKLSEYMMSGRPIIACMTGEIKNSKHKEIIENANIGICHEQANNEEDFIKLKEYIKMQYLYFKENNNINLNSNNDYIAKYNYQNLAKELEKELNKF